MAAPFRLDLAVWALRRRPHNAVDGWDGTTWRRTVVTGSGPAELAVRQEQGPAGPRLLAELRRSGPPPGASTTAEAARLVEKILGLRADLSGFYALAGGDPRLAPLAHRFAGMRPPRFPTVFEALVNAVACQQLSLTVGIHLLNRLASRYGAAPVRPGGEPAFPAPAQLAGADQQGLRELGFSGSKARTIILLARRSDDGADLDDLEQLGDDEVRAELLALPGIGRWSAEYTMLRGLGRWHVLPGDDVGARNNLRRRFGLAGDGGYDAIAELSQAWWPYGGLVYFHLLLDSLAGSGAIGGDGLGGDGPSGDGPSGDADPSAGPATNAAPHHKEVA